MAAFNQKLKIQKNVIAGIDNTCPTTEVVAHTKINSINSILKKIVLVLLKYVLEDEHNVNTKKKMFWQFFGPFAFSNKKYDKTISKGTITKEISSFFSYSSHYITRISSLDHIQWHHQSIRLYNNS